MTRIKLRQTRNHVWFDSENTVLTASQLGLSQLQNVRAFAPDDSHLTTRIEDDGRRVRVLGAPQGERIAVVARTSL